MKQIGNVDNHAETEGMLRQSDTIRYTDPSEIPKIERLVDVSVLTTFLRNFPIGNLIEEERHQFLAFQSYFIGIEAKCFDSAGFY